MQQSTLASELPTNRGGVLVPLELHVDVAHPVADAASAGDGGRRVQALDDSDLVAHEDGCLADEAVEADLAGHPAGLGHAHGDGDVARQHHGAEGERRRADGRQHHALRHGVDHAAATGERVSRGACGCGDDHSVSHGACEEAVVHRQLHVDGVAVAAAVEHHLVHDSAQELAALVAEQLVLRFVAHHSSAAPLQVAVQPHPVREREASRYNALHGFFQL
mmetsp:Transcript_2912/g.10212  ORF Transcript_2912/g.10212 Transcript_2912/m.10212 type:complete len:220 (+) Transcript_2912:30-689(+)